MNSCDLTIHRCSQPSLSRRRKSRGWGRSRAARDRFLPAVQNARMPLSALSHYVRGNARTGAVADCGVPRPPSFGGVMPIPRVLAPLHRARPSLPPRCWRAFPPSLRPDPSIHRHASPPPAAPHQIPRNLTGMVALYKPKIDAFPPVSTSLCIDRNRLRSPLRPFARACAGCHQKNSMIQASLVPKPS